MPFSSRNSIALCLFVSFIAGSLPAREWTDASGRKLEGELLGIERGYAVVFLTTRQRASLPITQLSAADQSWLKSWAANRTDAEQLPPPFWPETVQQPEIKLTGGASKDGNFIFHSPHYEFECDAEVSASVMNDFATVAEGTARVLYSLPVQLPSLQGRTYNARICRSRQTYERAGGPAGSAGVFISTNMSGEGVLLVPFESLGIEKFNGKNTKSYNYHPTVLIHEMAHQITAEMISLMPKWVAEGLAEYAGNTIYRNGTFYMGQRDRLQALHQRLEFYDSLTREQEARVMASPTAKPPPENSRAAPARLPESWIMKPSTLIAKSDADWATDVGGRAGHIRLHQMYLSSMFLMHYFLHIADNGEARRIRLYFAEINKDSSWFRTMGRDGSPPPDFITRRMTLDDIHKHYLQQLFDPAQLSALDADFRTKFIALGFRIPEWK